MQSLYRRGQFYSREGRFGALIISSCAATFLPLYAGTATKPQAAELVKLLSDPGRFWGAWPVPFVPYNHPQFEPQRYWHGPVWININWLIWRGLLRYGYTAEAADLRDRTLNLISQHGFSEYFHAQTGQGLGAHDFSWTAALTLDFLSQN